MSQAVFTGSSPVMANGTGRKDHGQLTACPGQRAPGSPLRCQLRQPARQTPRQSNAHRHLLPPKWRHPGQKAAGTHDSQPGSLEKSEVT